MGYTKGKWKFHDMERNTIVGQDHIFIATTDAQTRKPEENNANAHLIASAPTMYEALKNITNLPDNIACPTVKNFAKEAIKGVNNGT